MEYIQATSIPAAEKIKLANEVTTTVARKFADKKTKSRIDNHSALEATAVMQGSMRFLQTQGKP